MVGVWWCKKIKGVYTMNEVVDVLNEIKQIMLNMNQGIDRLTSVVETVADSVEEIKGSGLYNSISDVCDKIDSAVEDIKGNGLFNSITDICDKLDIVSSSVDSVDMTLSMK